MLECALSPIRLIYLYQDIRPLPVKDLLQVHFAHTTADSQADLFCDGYLLQHNSLYRRMRTLLHAGGGRLSSEDSPLMRQYLSFPLASLQEILDQRCVPYRNTIAGLQAIAAKRPDCHISMPFLFTSLHRNPVMHESAHLVWELLSPTQDWGFEGPRRTQMNQLLSALLAESFANAAEQLFANQARTVMGLLGILHTCYVGNPRLEARQQLEELGPAPALHGCLMMGFLFANLLHTSASAAVFEQVMHQFYATPLPAEQQAKLKEWFEFGFRLSVDFRTLTTRNYCHLNGWDQEHKALSRWNPFAHPAIAERIFATIRAVMASLYEQENPHALTRDLATVSA